MPKNIVICCDGTGNQFGPDISNVVKLFGALDLSDASRQVAYYHPGLGTMGAPGALTAFTAWWTKVFGLLFGRGLLDDIGDAYAFLMEAYAPGDRIFVFGFSRGAYTARALAGMVHMYGLIRSGDITLIRYAARLYRTKGPHFVELADRFRETFSRKCTVHFVGVWDTVSSVGWFHDVKLPYTAKNPDLSVFRQAISIDERRCYFWQNLWAEDPPPPSTQDVQQVWFPGVHSDIGGSYPESESGLSKITLKWMLREAKASGLLIDSAREDLILGNYGGGFARPDATAQLHRSLTGWWWIAEFLPRKFYDKTLSPPAYRTIIPLSRPRTIPAGSLIHASTFERMRRVASYKPPNLPEDRTEIE